MKLNIESAYVFIIAAVMLWAGPGQYLGHRLEHSFPTGYGASDAFQNYAITQGVLDNGNFRYQPMSAAWGYTDVIGYYPPVLYHLPGVFSSATGLPVWDTLILLVLVLPIFAALTLYFVIRKFSPVAAITGLPIAALIYSGRFAFGFLFGQWGFVFGAVVMVIIAWALINYELRYMYAYLGLLFAAVFLTHAPEFIFSAMLGAIILGTKLVKEFNKKLLMQYAVMAVLFLIVGSWYIIIFQNTWANTEPHTFRYDSAKAFEDAGAYPVPLIGRDLPLYLRIFSGFGLLTLLYFGFVGLTKKKIHYALIPAIFLPAIGLFNLIGFKGRAFQERFFWPLYLLMLSGLAFAFILRFAPKMNRTYIAIGIGSVLAIFIVQDMQVSQGSLMDPYHWDSMMWIRANTPKDSVIFFFYQDYFTQSAIYYSTQRETYKPAMTQYIEMLQSGKLQRNIVVDKPGELSNNLPYRKSLFEYHKHGDETPEPNPQDICRFDYYVIDKASRSSPEMARVNMIWEQQFLESGMEIVHSNQLVDVVKNNNPGGQCINEA